MPTAEVNGPLWGSRARDWAEAQEGTLRPAFEAVIAALDPPAGAALLDLGCGAGMAARIAADRGAQVSGIDAAEPLLAIARERVPEGDFRVADLEALPFAAGAFDVATAFNAIQYAGDPVAALIEARRVLRPGGRIAIVIWGEPAGMDIAAIITALAPLLPPPPPGARGPFALSDEAALRGLAVDAGLEIERIDDIDVPIVYPDRATALRGLASSGVAARVIGPAGAAAVDAAHDAALAQFRREGGSYLIGGRVRCLIARAPRA